MLPIACTRSAVVPKVDAVTSAAEDDNLQAPKQATSTSSTSVTKNADAASGGASNKPVGAGEAVADSLGGAATAPSTMPGTELRRQVDAVLRGYDQLLTELSSNPGAAKDLKSPLLKKWAAVVGADSSLGGSMIAEILLRANEEDSIVVPPTSGLSYVHRSLRAERTDANIIEFSWCGYSPGIGVNRSSGEVIDDAIAHSHGVGQLRKDRSVWLLDALDQIELRILPAKSADPCPSEVKQ